MTVQSLEKAHMSQKLFVDKLTILMRHYREASGMSQSEVAEALNIGLRSYQRYEAGESIPSVDLLYLFSKQLNFELKEFFSVEDWKTSLSHYKVYTGEDEKIFTSNPIIQESRILEVLHSPEFRKVVETGDIKHIRENEIFAKSPFSMALSQPKHTVLNAAHQKATGIYSDLAPTIAGHNDPKKLGMIWALSLENQKAVYFEDFSTPTFPKGTSEMKIRAIYTCENNHYLILSLAEIHITGKKK